MLSLICTASAHLQSQTPYIDNVYDRVVSESIGWIVNESKHMNGTSTEYSVLIVPDRFVTLFAAGASLWTTPFSITESNDSDNHLFMSPGEDDEYDVLASFCNGVVSETHLNKWSIWINQNNVNAINDSQWTAVLAHELGHVWGLNDLYHSYNANKIMYYAGNVTTATAPTYEDRAGAMVITGHHTTHRWTKTAAHHYCTICVGIGSHTPARGCEYTSNGVSTHTGYCSVCDYTFTETHNAYYSQTLGKCTACGYTGSIVMSIGEETE